MTHASHDVQELRDGLREARETLQKMTIVMQGEQERVAAIEAGLAADRKRLNDTAEGLTFARRQSDQASVLANKARQEAGEIRDRMQQASERIDSHTVDIASACARIQAMEGAAATANDRLGSLDGGTTDAHARINATSRELGQHGDELRSCRDLTTSLQDRIAAAEELGRQVVNAQQSAAENLRQLLDTRINPALVQGAEDRTQLGVVGTRLADLEIRAEKIDEETFQLRLSRDQATTERENLSGRLNELAAAEFQLEDFVAKATEEATAERERVANATLQIGSLQEHAKEVHSALVRVKVEVEEGRGERRQQSDQVATMADLIAALRHGLEVTDGEICSLRDVFNGVVSD